MNTDEVATPLELVVSVSVLVPLVVNMPLAPDEGAVNVTVAPLTGEPPCVTVATSGAVNATPTAALCGVPLVAAIVSAAGVDFDELPHAMRREMRTSTRERPIARTADFISVSLFSNFFLSRKIVCTAEEELSRRPSRFTNAIQDANQ